MVNQQSTQQQPAILYNVLMHGQTYGPYNMNVMAQMVQTGQLTPTTQVWRQGIPAWTNAGSLPELSNLFASVPPLATTPAPQPSTQYKIAVDGQTTGPFDLSVLAQMSKHGQLTSQSVVWKSGMTEWVPASTVPELASIISKNRPPRSWHDYFLPIENILSPYQKVDCSVVDEDTLSTATAIEDTLSEFKIEAEVTGYTKGPVITQYEILPAPAVKLSKIAALEDNIALRLAARIRVICPLPGKQAVGIEVPNRQRLMVSFREILETAFLQPTSMSLPLFLGKTISGDVLSLDLVAMPHILVAGTTGSGKSVCINAMILSLLYRLSPAQCRMIFIDAKVVELTFYNGIPHLLTPVITDPKRALAAMQFCVEEMERRYQMLAELSCRNIKAYNQKATESNIPNLPYIVVIIDEFADLMAVSSKEMEGLVSRLCAKSRAIGIHLVLATQRPSVNVVTGIIKANIPARIAFMVASHIDSRTIIDTSGADKLLGKGDMLYSGSDPEKIRAQGAYVSDDEADAVVAYLKTLDEPDYIDI
jgi:S-DNA-T family DNA segregation ATPase FtsK/SpoIIIE